MQCIAAGAVSTLQDEDCHSIGGLLPVSAGLKCAPLTGKVSVFVPTSAHYLPLGSGLDSRLRPVGLCTGQLGLYC